MRYLIGLPVCLVIISGILWFTSHGSYHLAAQDRDSRASADTKDHGDAAIKSSSQAHSVGALDEITASAFDPIIVSACTLTPIQEQNVASQIDGILTDVHVALGTKVAKDQCLAKLDDDKLRLQIELLRIKASSQSNEKIAQAMFAEADAKVAYAERANAGGLTSVPELELKTYLAQRERYEYEIKKAREDRDEAGKELEKAKVHLKQHQITSAMKGEIVKAFKKPGETVKQGEALFRLTRIDRLCIEGFCKVQHAPHLRSGQRVLVEAELQGPQALALIGHTAPVNHLAMSPDGKLLASASDDGSVLLWSWPAGNRLATLNHPAAVHAVDLVRLGDGNQAKYLIVTGGEDRLVRVWTYSAGAKAKGPFVELAGHEGSIRSVCVSADGKSCVTGGEDRRLGRWLLGEARDQATEVHSAPRWIHTMGAWKKTAHQGTITSVHLNSDGIVVSTGSDNVQKVWQTGPGDSKLLKVHHGRTGDVPRLSVSPDGTRLFLDHGDELRILDRDSGAVLGAVQNPKHVRFEEFARFSPSQRLILAASADGRLQLSRTPVEPKQRSVLVQMFQANPQTAPLPKLGGMEVRQYHLPKASQARCGVFAPDETVFFTAGSDRVIRAWLVPPEAEWEPREATLIYVGNELEPGTDLVRIRAELENPSDPSRWWRPGTFVHLKIFPTTRNQ